MNIASLFIAKCLWLVCWGLSDLIKKKKKPHRNINILGLIFTSTNVHSTIITVLHINSTL